VWEPTVGDSHFRGNWFGFGGVEDCVRLTTFQMASHQRPGPGPDLPDEVLVARARTGDRSAYGELVRRHQSAALRLAAAICGSAEEARDIVQDALVKGYRSLDRYRSEAPVRAWLLRIVANDAKNAVRARGRRHGRERRFESLRQGAGGADPVGEHVVDADEVERLLALLGRLGERDRTVLACRFVAGLSEPETAATLGVPIGTVKSRTARALSRARAVAAAGTGREVGYG
jgi:RNA polymerase sigma factor (sigma-70 family)